MMSFEKTFMAVDLIFKINGIPPHHQSYPDTVSETVKLNTIFFAAFLILLYTTLGEFICLLQMLQSNPIFMEIAFQAPCFGYCTIGIAKTLVLAVKRNSIAELVQSFRNLWKKSITLEEHQRLCEEVMKPAIYITTMTVVVNAVMAISFVMSSIPEMIYNYKITGKWVRQLPFTVWWPFDPYSGIAYIIVYLFYIAMDFYFITIHMIFDYLFCIFCAHLCLHFKILKYDLENVAKQDQRKKNERVVNAVTKCFKLIEQHQHLNECKVTMDGIFSLALCYTFFISSLMICIQGFMVTTTSGYTFIKFVLFLACSMIELFLLCFYGQDIKESSAELADAAFYSCWYNQGQQFGRIILQVLAKAQKPLFMMAWKIWPVNLGTFSSIMSASWSYFTLLRTVYRNQ